MLFTMRITPEDRAALDELVKRRGFRTAAEAIRWMIRNACGHEKAPPPCAHVEREQSCPWCIVEKQAAKLRERAA